MLSTIFCFFFCSFKGFLLFLYMMFEFNYFLRILFYAVYLRFMRTRLPFFDTFTTYDICTTNDLDFLLHMNNSRYLRALDFNRIWFWVTSGKLCNSIIYEARQFKGSIVLSASTIRYRKPITFLQPYKIDLKVLYWDDRSMYAEQSFTTLHDGFVRAIALTKQTSVGPSMSELVERVLGESVTSPLPTAELVKWMETNELSSKKLRALDKDQYALQPFKAADRIFGKINTSPCACLNESICSCPDREK
uniref:Protein THEM6 n=1 Tax=Strigamia maritima TaxID=126957 RepID=T1JL52_STRMM